jgi:hypothetical protein
MSSSSSSTIPIEKYADFRGWTPYSGTMTEVGEGWQYKEGKYEKERCVFYRQVPFVASNTSVSRRRAQKHNVVCILLSKTPSMEQWKRMRTALKSKSSSLKLYDFRVAKVTSTRKRVRITRCRGCDGAITSMLPPANGLCSTCNAASLLKKRKFENKEKEKKKEEEAAIAAKELEILQLKAELTKQETLRLAFEHKCRSYNKSLTKLTQDFNTLKLENSNSRFLVQQQEIELVEKISSLIETDVTTSDQMANIASSITKVSTDISMLNEEAEVMKRKLEVLYQKMNGNTNHLLILKAGVQDHTFELSVIEDFYYFGVYRCSSTSIAAGTTGIERLGNIMVYNKQLLYAIRKILRCEIPIVKERMQTSGTIISIDALSYYFPHLDFVYGTHDIVYRVDSSNSKSLRSNRELIIPLLQLMLDDELYDSEPLEVLSPSNGRVITRTFRRLELGAMKQSDYETIFMLAWKYHFERGIHQTFQAKENGTYFNYSQYLFTVLDQARVSFVETRHGRAHENNPVGITLHTYCITYTYEYDDPSLRLTSAGQATAMEGYSESVIQSIKLRL